jgi:shikimate dehydrogenase
VNIDKETQLCISLAARPGNFGTRFHNFLYRELGLNFIYKAFAPSDLEGAVKGLRALGIRGSAISMPLKEAVIEFVDEMMPSAFAIQAVNTVVNDAGWLRAYNTDYIAVLSLLKSHNVPTNLRFVLRGSGGMAKAVTAALREAGFANGTIVARNEMAGRALARQYGYEWESDLFEEKPGFLINVTPIGMAGGREAAQSAFPEKMIRATEFAFDVVAAPPETPLVRFAREQDKPVITGGEVIVLQALEQFVLYTGVRPSDEQALRAAEFALK